MQKKRLAWPDIAKAIAIFLVVVGHSSPPATIYALIFSFHMPFFFMMSGYFYKFRDANLKNDLIRLICPYCLCILILLAFMRIDPSSSPYQSFYKLIISAIYASGSTINGVKLIGAIWFLQALFVSRRFMDFIFYICDSEIVRLVLVLWLLIVSISLAWKKIYLPLGLDVGMLGTFYLYSGYLLKNYGSKLIESPKANIFLILIFAWYISYRTGHYNMSDRAYVDLFFVTIPGSIAASVLLMLFSKMLEKFHFLSTLLSKFGQHTLLLLCVHDLDWRLPFGFYHRLAQLLIFPYKGNSYYWILSFILRFAFDVFVMIIVLLLIKIIRLLTNLQLQPQDNG